MLWKAVCTYFMWHGSKKPLGNLHCLKKILQRHKAWGIEHHLACRLEQGQFDEASLES